MVVPAIDNVFIIRHGERLDHAVKMWRPDPSHGLWDPPLSDAGHAQAERTGQRLVELLEENGIDLETTRILIYTSPFQRCIDTSLGIARHVPNTILRLELGLGEWMCERFFEEDIAPAARLLSRQQEALARKQAEAFSTMAKKNDHQGNTITTRVPWVDYGYRALRNEFEFPERYGDMLRRFDETRIHCMAQASTAAQLPKSPLIKNNETLSDMVVLFVTHAVGVNALLDGFRNQLTRPIETGYCSISRVIRAHPSKPTSLTSPITPPPPLPSPKEEKDTSDLHISSLRDEWIIDLLASDTHIVN